VHPAAIAGALPLLAKEIVYAINRAEPELDNGLAAYIGQINICSGNSSISSPGS
jgi:hypothetical protein